MSIFYVTRLGIALPALAALGLLGAIGGDATKAQAGTPLECRIDVGRSAGMVELKALISADRTTSGSYRLNVVKSGGGGSANIGQGGEFSVSAGTPQVVSSVMLGGDGRYMATLTVNANGRNFECSRRIGGSL